MFSLIIVKYMIIYATNSRATLDAQPCVITSTFYKRKSLLQ